MMVGGIVPEDEKNSENTGGTIFGTAMIAGITGETTGVVGIAGMTASTFEIMIGIVETGATTTAITAGSEESWRRAQGRDAARRV